MIIALLVLATIQIDHSSCPENFELVKDGQCRGSYAAIDIASHDSTATNIAISKCKEIDSVPIIIHSEEENSYWSNWKEANGSSPTYNWPIGLTCNTQSKRWEWADGSPLDYKPWLYYPGLDQPCNPDCGWTMWKTGEWADYCAPTSNWVSHIFCTKQLQQPPRPSGCENFQEDADDQICFQVGEYAETWQEAQLNCRNVGADLASIHNSQENTFVRRLAVSQGAVNGVFLGGTLSGKGSDFVWIDGTAWDYTNFYSGFPMAGLGDCLAMDTSSSTGQWMNRDCSSKLPVACIRNETSVASVPTCRSDTWKEGEVMTSPGFPFSASLPCDFILKAEEGKKIELQIIMLEANSCCDSLLIYDDFLGGNLIANLTGEIRNATHTTNSQFAKVVWNPNGGVNVRGMAMVFRGV